MSTSNLQPSQDYTPRLVAKRKLKSGVVSLRPMETNPLPNSRESEDQKCRQWLVNDQTQSYLNNIIRDVKAIGGILGKNVEKENFLQILANFLYKSANGPITTQISIPSTLHTHFDVDTEVLAKRDDGAYYKAVIEKKTGNGFVIRYIDFAESKEVVATEIKEFEKLPCAVTDCGSLRMEGFPYCKEHQSALSCGTFDSSKIMANSAPKKSVFVSNVKASSSNKKDHYATMPGDMSKKIQENNKQVQGSSTRQKVREEIYSTEVKYCKNLAIVMESYVIPLRQHVNENSHYLDSNTLTNLISNWETLASFHQAFLGSLQMTDNIPKVFIKYSDYFKLYTHYLNSYDKCLTALDGLRSNKKFSTFMVQVGNNFRLKGKLDLMSYLIMPVQRVPRYVMLLRELKKNTPAEHPQYEDLEQAIEKIADIAKHINETKRKAENLSILFRVFRKISGLKESDGLVLMQPYRVFIREGTVIEAKLGGILTTLKETNRNFYLFNDILLWTTENNKYKGWLNLSASKISRGSEKDKMEDWIEIKTAQVVLLFKAKDGKGETEKWYQILQKVVDRRNQARKEKMKKRAERMRHRVVKKQQSTLNVGGREKSATHSTIAASLADLKQQTDSRNEYERISMSREVSISLYSEFDDNELDGHCIASPQVRSPSTSSPRHVVRRSMRSTGKLLHRPTDSSPIPISDRSLNDSSIEPTQPLPDK